MKTAILGGSFNPVHRGHVELAREVGKLGFERIIFIPAARPPHKELAGGASDSDRVEMLRLALAELDWTRIWDGELHRDGPSYTIDTVRQLRRENILYEPPGLVIGDDLLPGFSRWMKARELLEETQIIVARRLEDPPAPPDFPCMRLDNPLWPYSSTQVRGMIGLETLSGEILSPAVRDYIQQRGLYGVRD